MENKSSIGRFIKSSAIFFVGTVLSKLISILLLPVYTSNVPTADMGYYDLSLTYITIVTSLLFIDIWVAILRYMYDCKEENGDKKSTVIKSGMAIFGISSLLYFAVAGVLAIFFEVRGLLWIALYGITHNLSTLFAYCARGFGKNVDFSAAGIINTLINILTTILCFNVFGMGFEALYIAGILGYISQVIYLSVRTDTLKSLFLGKFDKAIMSSMFKYSLPLCVNSISYWLLTSLNKTILNAVYGDSISGIFAIGSKFGMLINLVTTCFTLAWQDLSFSAENELEGEKKGKFYSSACNAYALVLCACTVVMLPAIKLVFPILVDASYAQSEATIPLFLCVAIISAISTFIGNVFYAIKDTKSIFYSMVAAALLNLAIGYPLISMFGPDTALGTSVDGAELIGMNLANVAVILGYTLNIIIRAIILNKKMKFKLSPKIILFILATAVSSIIFALCGFIINAVWFVVTAAGCLFMFRKYILQVLNAFIKKKKE